MSEINPAKIAKGLTKAQAFALLRAVERGAPWCRCWYAGMSRAATKLAEKGLVEIDYRKSSGTWVMPTYLGKAVAEAIREAPDA